jgi:lipoyl(octanoyl) transferase
VIIATTEVQTPGALPRAPVQAPRVRRLGRCDYLPTWQSMKDFTAGRSADTPDELWLVEHPPVYTVGIAGRPEHFPRTDSTIPIVRTDRGGQITYHGPGQIVVYTLLDLRRLGLTVRALVRTLEDAIVGLLAEHGLAARGDVDRPGVYVGSAKIAALGLKVRGGCCYHGLSLNVDMDLSPFGPIDPCGYPGLAVTDLRREGIAVNRDALAEGLVQHLMERLHG